MANDYRLKLFVRDGYEWAWHHLCPRLGLDTMLEGCTTADLVALGVQLSSAGLGDFWDQVDVMVRNSLSEAQVTDSDALRKLSESGPERPQGAPWGVPQDFRFLNSYVREPLPGQETTQAVLERAIGGFACNLVNGRFQSPFEMGCCTANGNQGFYYAWEAVVRGSGGTATINLLFNRFSPWLDLESYLHTKGKPLSITKKPAISRSVSPVGSGRMICAVFLTVRWLSRPGAGDMRVSWIYPCMQTLALSSQSKKRPLRCSYLL